MLASVFILFELLGLVSSIHAVLQLRTSQSAIACLIFLVLTTQGCGPTQELWHSTDLSEEFTAKETNDVKTLANYQALEERLFIQLGDEVFIKIVGKQHYLW